MHDGSSSNKDSVAQENSNDEIFRYSYKDTILYALSLNMSTKDDLKFLYENHEEFSVFPTYGVIPSQDAIFGKISSFELPQGVTLDPTRLLHGNYE